MVASGGAINLIAVLDDEAARHLMKSIRFAIEGLICSAEQKSGFAAQVIDLIEKGAAFDLTGSSARGANEIVFRLQPSEALRNFMSTIKAGNFESGVGHG